MEGNLYQLKKIPNVATSETQNLIASAPKGGIESLLNK